MLVHRKSVAKTALVCLVLAIVILISLMIFAGVFDRFFTVRDAEAENVVPQKQKTTIFGDIPGNNPTDPAFQTPSFPFKRVFHDPWSRVRHGPWTTRLNRV